MEFFLHALLWWRVLGVVAIYHLTRAFYRLFLHPLSRFPGPKLAAVSRLYEAYYDIYQNGQYTFKISRLHKQYGPIVRISPYELHVSDPAFFEHLYRHEGRWDKYAWATDAFAARGATIFTANHDLHKARRHPLNPFFSKARVAAQQDIIYKHLEKLCGRLAIPASRLNLGAAITAFARDVANDFVLGKSYNSLERLDYAADMSDHGTKVFFQHLEETQQDARNLIARATSPNPDTSPRTIVHGIVESKLPSSEKAEKRVMQDVSTVTGAGFETTASALRVIIFNVFNDPTILRRLRQELMQCAGNLELKTLEQLPYLNAILMEGLRLSPAIATRMARISPDADVSYQQWKIPAGTPVGMTLVLMHSDPSLYPDPFRFNPDRWMEPDARKKVDKTFAPFSRGTRVCLGMYLAWAEMYILVAALVQRFDFEYHGARTEDFLCNSDNFAIGTPSDGVLYATATRLGSSQEDH
ncbi:cytochrome P450 [Xylariomycetidae sp. FL0641]|nr:cytochrome P450 [Xylariomycetidae sp. FL0641]